MKVNFKSINFMDKSSMDKFRWRLRSLEYSLHTCINSRLSPLQCSVSLVLFSPPRPSLSIPLSLHFFLHPVSQDGPLVTSTDGFPAGCTGRQGSIHTVINTLFFFQKRKCTWKQKWDRSAIWWLHCVETQRLQKYVSRACFLIQILSDTDWSFILYRNPHQKQYD